MNHLVFRGSEVVVSSGRSGKDLTIDLDPDDLDLPACLGVLRHLMNRSFSPVRSITVEQINGVDAGRSPYVDVFETMFEARTDYKTLILNRRI